VHELSIAKSLIELACEYAQNEGACKVTRLSVRLGSESLVIRSLYFCFDSATKGTLCEDAVLDIEEVPLSAHCPACDEPKLLPSRTSFRCPDCGTPTPKVLTGREMQLVSLNLEYPDVKTAPPPTTNQETAISGERYEY
jgi:hydrogenase nickel incorporation protein HypA/HybF